MPQLTISTDFKKGKKKHNHILYLNEEMGTGVAVEEDGHTHEVMLIPPSEPVMDEMGNVIQEGQEGGWIVMPSEDGHTHDISEYKPNYQNKDKREEDEIAGEVNELFKQALELEADSRKKAKESEKFYKGDQWDETNKRKLENEDRACLTINELTPAIDTLIGYQIENRQRLDFTPLEGGDQATADILNIIINDHIWKRCDADHEETEVFSNMVKCGRGNFEVYLDTDTDLEGKICIKSIGWQDVVYGPHEKKDASDAEYLIKHKMYSKAKVKQLWPEKASKIDKEFDSYTVDQINNDNREYKSDGYGKTTNKMPLIFGDDTAMIDVYRKNIRILECHRKIYEKINIFINANDGFVLDGRGWNPKDVEKVKKIPGFNVINRTVPRIRITTIAANTVLDDQNPADLPDDAFYTVPAYSYKQGNDWWGKIEGYKDLQKELNYRYSQSIDIGNRMATSGWMVTEDTFPDGKRGAQKFKSQVAKPGFVVDINDYNRMPQRVEGSNFPAEIVQLMQLSSDKIKSNMNVVFESGGANESGSKMLQRQKIKMAAHQILFDNLSLAKRKVGRLLIGLVKRYYDAEKIFRIVNDVTAANPDQTIAGQSPADFTQEQIQAFVDNLDIGKYDVLVTESPDSPSTRISSFLLMSDLAQNGAPIPPELLIDMSAIPKSIKDKSLNMLQQQQEMQSQATATAGDSEVEKTLVGKGIIPPSVAERFGIQPGTIQENVASEGGAFPRPSGSGRKRKVVTFDISPDGKKQAVIDEVDLEGLPQ